MKETVEHNNRFYTNEKGEIKTENEQLKEWLTIANKENERLNNKLLLIKGIIRTPRELDKSLAYAMVKTQIENVLGSDKE